MVVPLGPALGHVVRELRESHGMPLAALAADADLNEIYVRDIEEGQRNPSLSILGQLARSLGVRVSDLIIAAEQRDEGPPT